MPIAFFVSSLGDTELAKATIRKLVQLKPLDSFLLVALTATAQKYVDEFNESVQVKRVSLADITKQADVLSKKQIAPEDLGKVLAFIQQNNIDHAYIGVPSPVDEEIAFQIASVLKIPYTIAYEYMFTAPANHSFWNYVGARGAQQNCQFAVPLPLAKEDILAKCPAAKIHLMSHLSIDPVLSAEVVKDLSSEMSDIKKTRSLLSIFGNSELGFISGTTQPPQVDMQFVEALLSEISKGKHPHVQLRFGLHPGVKDLDGYLNALLAICAKYPKAEDQFKVVLSPQLEKKLQHPVPVKHPFILRAEVTGTQMSQAADKIAQAVPGALLNTAVLKGKPSYFHDKSVKSYLPKQWFSENLSLFFAVKQQVPHKAEELGIKDTASSLLANFLCG